VFKYGQKYQPNKLDKMIGFEMDDKLVDCKTDTRCFGSLFISLYQKYSQNCCNLAVNSSLGKFLQVDPEITIEERDLIACCTDSLKSERPDIRDLILHEKFLKNLI
jgi:hypothetical protein